MASEASAHGANAALRRIHRVLLTPSGEIVVYVVERRKHPDGNVGWSSLDYWVDVDRNGIIIVCDRLGLVVARYREWSALTLGDPIGRQVNRADVKEIEV